MKSLIITIALAFIYPNLQAQVQYKRLHRNIMADLHDGNIKQGIQSLQDMLAKDAYDPETHYTLAVAYTLDDKLDLAMEHVLFSLRNGLPFDRYLAGPREWLAPLVESQDFKKIAQLSQNPPTLIHGPMLGSMTPTSVSLWVRTYQESPVKVLYSPSLKMNSHKSSAIAYSQAGNDYTAVVQVSDLAPETTYYYKLVIDKDTLTADEWSFATFPEKGNPINLSVGFGGGAGYTPQYTRMWSTLASHRFPAFLLLGDNVYIDHPERPEVQDYVYYRRQSEARYRSFVANTPVFAVWDDHDFGTNDSWGTAAKLTPDWKLPVWQKYRNNWNNPYYGGGEDNPGVWTDFSLGDVDFFMLDSRYYRTAPDNEEADMLGPVQLEWLLAKLKASEATFKIIASPVPWSFESKKGTQMTPSGPRPGGMDTWLGFSDQRNRIFDFIVEEQIEGVVLISADRHRSDAWKIGWKGYDFYEFESSKLTNLHTHGIMPESIFGYNEKCSFGVLHFDTTQSDPEVTYKIYNIDNELINQMTLRLSQLDF